jgi:hypothetical protein
MEALKMSNWNDDRLDKRDEEVKEGFTEVRSEISALRSEMHQGFAEMHSAYAALNRTLLLGAGGIIAALIGVAGALVVALAA